MDTPIKISISILPILEDIQIVLECDILHSQVSKSVNSITNGVKKGFKRTYQYCKSLSYPLHYAMHTKCLFCSNFQCVTTQTDIQH